MKEVGWSKMSKDAKCSVMKETRDVAFRLAREGYLLVTHKGAVLPSPCHESVKGPIRLRLASASKSELPRETVTVAITPAEVK